MIDPTFQKKYEAMVSATTDDDLLDAMFDVVQFLSVTVDGLRARVSCLEEIEDEREKGGKEARR